MSADAIINLNKKSTTSSKAYSTRDPCKQYIVKHSLRITDVQESLIKETMKQTRAVMLSSPDELQLLANLCRVIGAKKTLDLGVFTGYSALTIAMALPEDGKVIACDVSEEFTNVGKPFWKAAGVDKKIDLRLAPATETLEKLIEDGQTGTFDFAFIDADKLNYQTYYELCLKLIRPGGFIAVDNTLWSGTVVDVLEGKISRETKDPEEISAIIIHDLNEFLSKDDRIEISFLNIGDGTTLCFKK
ncbi:DgyrCDS5621 [Dimorphilus gyrociliatus]|uniref:DgyrCDS5621 n=1 Tax=Dimorphilus gyrociliatus TaxID=2664684 RepID=A0A7I8VKI2_9ANNE|nr:DgyrCDS5621 [Dimorphilus gyrociliatus]